MSPYGACAGCGSYGRWGHPCPCNTPQAEWTPEMRARVLRRDAGARFPYHPPVQSHLRQSRANAYAAQQAASRAHLRALESGADAQTLALLRAESELAWTEYRRWVKADSVAAQAGAFDHISWQDA